MIRLVQKHFRASTTGKKLLVDTKTTKGNEHAEALRKYRVWLSMQWRLVNKQKEELAVREAAEYATMMSGALDSTIATNKANNDRIKDDRAKANRAVQRRCNLSDRRGY